MNKKSHMLYHIVILYNKKFNWKVKKYLINKSYNLEKNFIRSYIRLHIRSD